MSECTLDSTLAVSEILSPTNGLNDSQNSVKSKSTSPFCRIDSSEASKAGVVLSFSKSDSWVNMSMSEASEDNDDNRGSNISSVSCSFSGCTSTAGEVHPSVSEVSAGKSGNSTSSSSCSCVNMGLLGGGGDEGGRPIQCCLREKSCSPSRSGVLVSTSKKLEVGTSSSPSLAVGNELGGPSISSHPLSSLAFPFHSPAPPTFLPETIAWMGDIWTEGEGDSGDFLGRLPMLPGRRTLFALGVGVKRELEQFSGVNSGIEHFRGGVRGICSNWGELGDDGPAVDCDSEENISLDVSGAAKTGQVSFAAMVGGGADFGVSNGFVLFKSACFSLL